MVDLYTDDKEGLIVQSDVVAENNDLSQFHKQISEANEVVGKKCQNVCGDAGYFNVPELLKVSEENNINVVVPSNKQAQADKKKQFKLNKFDKSNFTYNPVEDVYICPAGQTLKKAGIDNSRKQLRFCYKIDYAGKVCRECKFFGECTKDKTGRRVYRLSNEDIRKGFEENYKANQDIYKKRKSKAELPFAYIKHNLGIRGFQLRGLKGAIAEGSLYATCFNLKRMMNILGSKNLIAIMVACMKPKATKRLLAYQFKDFLWQKFCFFKILLKNDYKNTKSLFC